MTSFPPPLMPTNIPSIICFLDKPLSVSALAKKNINIKIQTFSFEL